MYKKCPICLPNTKQRLDLSVPFMLQLQYNPDREEIPVVIQCVAEDDGK